MSRLAAVALIIVMSLSMARVAGDGRGGADAVDAAARADGYVMVGWTGDFEYWNPLTLTIVEDYVACNLIHSSLFMYDEDLQGPVGDLAMGWLQTLNPDGSMTTEIAITQNAYFRTASDPYDTSRQLTADDVEFTFNLIRNNPDSGTWRSNFIGVTDVDALDRFTVSITTAWPKATLFDDLEGVPILPEYVYGPMHDPFAQMDPDELVGSGPFVFDAMVEGSWYSFAKAPNYHGEADYGAERTVSVPGIIYSVYYDNTALALAINYGDLDVVSVGSDVNTYLDVLGSYATANVIKQAVSEPGICDVAINAIPMSFRTSTYGTGNPHLLDPAVRQALAMTLNKTYITDVTLSGLAEPATAVIQPGYWQADIEELAFDPLAALDLLMRSGYADLDGDGYLQATADAYAVREGLVDVGDELSMIRLDAPDTDPTYYAVTTMWAADARDAGIGLVPRILSEGVMINMDWYKADYDIWVWHWGWGPEPIGSALSTWLTSEIVPGGLNCQMPMGPWWYDGTNYTDAPAEWDLRGPYSAYDQNLSMALETLDREDRKAIVDNLQQMIYDSHTEIPPFYDIGLYGYTDQWFVGWGDWESHPGRTVTSDLLWLWFDLVPRGDNLPPVFDVPLLPAYQATAGEVITFEVVVSDPEGDALLVNWSFGDGETLVTQVMGTSVPTTVRQSHVYSYAAAGLELEVRLHDGVQGHEVISLATVDVLGGSAGGRTVGYWWHDMFSEPFGEWWEWRYTYYGICEPVTTSYPYIYRTNGPDGPDAYHSSMQLNVMANDLPEVNMNDRPQFLPLLGEERGGLAVIDWRMQYLTGDQLEHYPDVISVWYDGWAVGLNGTTYLDSTAAKAVLGITDDGLDDFPSWWAANEAAFETAYLDWMMHEANERLDIFPMYEYAFTPLSFDLDAYSYDGNVVLQYDVVSWGMEALMTRWLHDAFMPTEWMFEDFVIHAEIGPDSADIDVDTAVVGAVFAWKDLETQQPSWAWRGMHQDYVPSSLTHPVSDFDAYEYLECLDMYAGSVSYGSMTPYEYTPAAFDLAEGEEMWFEWPDGPQSFVTDGGVDWFSTSEYMMASPYSEPAGYDLPGVTVDPLLNTLTFEGPIDVCSWSQAQTTHDYLESEWDRLGVLPYGLPWIEFAASTGPVEPACMMIEGLPDPVRVNQSLDIAVTVLDQYGYPFEGYTGTVTFSSSDTHACLPVDYTFTAADGGSHTFYDQTAFYTEGEQSLVVSDTADPLIQATAYTTVLPQAQGKQWTVMVYLDGDNNLEEVGLIDFVEMASAGSTEDVNIVVQFDRAPGYISTYGDWTDTRRFYVTEGQTPDPYNAVEVLGELDMGDPATLADFVAWASANHPAENYMLVLWDHGGGWDGAVCWDETDYYDALTMDEVEWALSAGVHLDVLGYDACLMAMAEVIYETREYVDYVVASEETVPWDGWPYDTIMGDLVADPLMTPAELSSAIVGRYMDYYGTYGIETMSAVDVGATAQMYDSLEAFAQELIAAMPDHEEVIRYCRANTTSFSDMSFIDLYDFAFEVGDIYTTDGLVAAADALWAAVGEAVVAEGHGDYRWDAHGVSIYFPDSGDWYWEHYEDVLDFTAETSWDEFLVQYLMADPDAYEPDDVYTEATELVEEVTQTHSLHTEEDADWFVFTLAADDNVSVRTQGTWGEFGVTTMYLFDEAGVPYDPLAWEEDGGYDYWATIEMYLPAGTYFASVESFYPIEGYDITLYVGDLPNMPPVISLGVYPWPVAGIESTFDATYSYDPDGWIVSYFWDFGDGTTAYEAVVNHTYEAPGWYLLFLEVVDDDGASTSFSYDLYVDEAAGPDAYEPDDTFDQASDIQLGETQEHSIAPGAGDVDWVTFTLDDATDVDIRTSFADGDWGDTVIALYDEGGVPDSWIAYNDDWTYDLSSRIVASLPAGTYWVQVWSYGYYNEIPSYYISLNDAGTMNEPPVAQFMWWPEQPAPGQVVLFDAWNSYDPDGWITQWHWDFGDNSTADGQWAEHAFDEVGDYIVTLTVVDDCGAQASASAMVCVRENAAPVPVLDWTPMAPAVGEAVLFNASGSYDPDGWVDYYVFDYGDGYAEGAPWSEMYHTYNAEGVYTVTLTVYDNNWLAGSVSAEIAVGGEGAPPVAVIAYEPSMPAVGDTVAFDASHSFDPDGAIVSYIWQFGDGDVAEGMTATHAYEHEGVYSVKLTVMDGDLMVDEDVVTITVASVPVPAMVYSPLDPDEGELVTFYAYGSYDEGGIVEYVWSFGDGTYASGWEAAHVFAEQGDYEVTLTVTNMYGVQASITQTVEVGKGDSGVKGVVMSESLRPLKNAVVEVRTSGGALVGSTLTDAQGEFMIRDLVSGVYDLTVSKNGYADFTVSITVGAGVLDVGTIVLLDDQGSGSAAAPSDEESLWLVGAAGLVGMAMLGGFLVSRKKGSEQ
ncbi:MAG: PKD domain-containing protein [Candidatus Thermoplasmatota archaeon]